MSSNRKVGLLLLLAFGIAVGVFGAIVNLYGMLR